jgi:hypothetical protein
MIRDGGLVSDGMEGVGMSLPQAQAEPADQQGLQPPAGLPAIGHAGTAQVPAAGERAAYLAEVCRLLWPAPARVSVSGAGGIAGGQPADSQGGTDRDAAQPEPEARPAASEFIVLPGTRRPRLLVPAGRRAAAAAVRRYGEPGSLRTRLATRGLSLLLGSGMGGAVLRDRLHVQAPAGAPTIESYLRATLGLDISVSMHLGAARANRKPVLQLLTAAGDTVGFAKIGVSPLTRDLVRAERDALVRLGSTDVASLAVPSVLHYGSWQDLTVIVLSPLPVWQRRVPLASGQLTLAMGEVAAVAGISRWPLAASGYWRTLGERLAIADDTEDRRALLKALEAVGQRAGDAVLCFGAWHGDWTPWNMASTRSGLLVWDWERFAIGVPLGFDALHHWLQAQVISGRRDPLVAAAGCVKRADALLAPLGVGTDEARLTALVYLADLAARYLLDRQAEAGARLGAPSRWLIPALADGTAQL